MVQSVVSLRVLYGHDVLNVLHHTHCCSVSSRVRADRAHLCVADIMADAAIFDVLSDMQNGVSKAVYTAFRLSQQVQNQAQCRLTANAWQLAELAHCPLKQHRRVLFHQSLSI